MSDNLEKIFKEQTVPIMTDLALKAAQDALERILEVGDTFPNDLGVHPLKVKTAITLLAVEILVQRVKEATKNVGGAPREIHEYFSEAVADAFENRRKKEKQ